MAKLADIILGKAKKAGGESKGSPVVDKIRARAAGPSEAAEEAAEEPSGLSDDLFASVAADIASGDEEAIAAGLRALFEAKGG